MCAYMSLYVLSGHGHTEYLNSLTLSGFSSEDIQVVGTGVRWWINKKELDFQIYLIV